MLPKRVVWFFLVSSQVGMALQRKQDTPLKIFETFATGGFAARKVVPFRSVWCGTVLGISFVEAWVKFQSPFLPRGFAYDVGRTVFPAINALEAALCVTAWTTTTTGTRATTGLALATACLAVQMIFVTPALSARAENRVLAMLKDHPYVVNNLLSDTQRAHYAAETTQTKKEDTPTTSSRGGKWLHVAYILCEVVKVGGLLIDGRSEKAK